LLAVTSARIGMTSEALADAPLSGKTLLIDPSARGVPAPRFAG
jgi:sugar lactone lactonase YvrE